MTTRRHTATAWLLRFLVLVAVAVVAFVPPVTTQEVDTARITRYVADFELSADGTLVATETIDVEMPGGKHGIYRIFDIADNHRYGVDHPVTDVTVTRDGAAEPVEWTDSNRGSETLRIGSASVFLTPGQHQYVITSTTSNALERGPDGTVVWWWNVVGSGWQMAMDSVSVTARLPAEVTKAECVQGEDTACTADLSERTLRVDTGPLAPFTPVTVRATFPAGALAEPPAEPTNLPWLWSTLAALIGAGLGIWFVVATRERRPGFPVLFEPPQGVSPALGAKVLSEVDSDDDLQATLYDLGAKGVIRLDGDDEAWNVNLLVDPQAAQVPEMERAMLAGLGLTQAGDSFLVTSTASAGEMISTARSTLRGTVARQAEAYLQPSAAGIIGNLLGWVAVLGVFGLAGLWLFGRGTWFGWPLFAGLAAFALVAVQVSTDPGTRTKRTAEGRELWSRTGGFARFLTTDSAESRFEAAKHLDWYPTYLAWALVFGSADAWARRFSSQGVEVPVLPWIYWTGIGHPGPAFASSMASSFDAAISSASASYAASQAQSAASSFGGGGGFSGGSGGGGGGGGSW
ncbi:DUF2207 domain-containing protein [Dermatobacter hominis]|uniref:DUF2207 domain-containing protein n=1 Tax=Dermatobacter hominis TaxID=2884263 RepID=UPI001D0F9A0C|nr:DUF2207 domain-containing protein [Dermatobacter hominis]UDY35421.1 DUF2207 domain-containing protein [Dermatobacter hominis]